MSENPKPIEARKSRLGRLRFLIAAFGVAALFLLGLWQYSIATRNDFARPVLEQQIALCMEASETAATLAQPAARKGDNWREGSAARRFLTLYYGKLGVVQDRCVYDAMALYKTSVFDELPGSVDASRLALTVSFACRRLLSQSWNSGLAGLYDSQNLIESFRDLDDYRRTMGTLESCRL